MAAGRSARPNGLSRNGFNLLTGNVITGDGTDDFFTAQSRLIQTYRAVKHAAPGRAGPRHRAFR